MNWLERLEESGVGTDRCPMCFATTVALHGLGALGATSFLWRRLIVDHSLVSSVHVTQYSHLLNLNKALAILVKWIVVSYVS